MKLSCVLISLFFVFNFCFAQSTNIVYNEPGKKALSFSFNGLNLGSYYGGIGGKYWLSKTSTLSAAIDIDYRKDQRETTTGEALDRISENTTLGLTIGYEKYLRDFGKLLPYIGFSLSGGITNSSSITEFLPGYKSERITNSKYIRFGTAIGAEYFLSESFSIAGQHRFQITYIMGKSENIDTQQGGNPIVSKQDLTGLNFGLGATSLVLSVYF